jgi:hypothetical protein
LLEEQVELKESEEQGKEVVEEKVEAADGSDVTAGVAGHYLSSY